MAKKKKKRLLEDQETETQWEGHNHRGEYLNEIHLQMDVQKVLNVLACFHAPALQFSQEAGFDKRVMSRDIL